MAFLPVERAQHLMDAAKSFNPNNSNATTIKCI